MNTSPTRVFAICCTKAYMLQYKIIYSYDLRGSYSRESMKSLLDDEKFISRRNFSVKQAPSAEVIYYYAIHTQRSTADSKENPTQRYYLLLALQLTTGKNTRAESQAHS